MRATFIFHTIVLLSSCFFVGAMAEDVSSPRVWVAPDFYVSQDTSSSWKGASRDCRTKIATIVCLAEPEKSSGQTSGQKADEPESRPCLAGSSTYVEVFEDLYDAYPPALQRMFCSLRRIFVEKNFGGTAYAGSVTDASGASKGAVVGIRQSVIDDQLSLSQWASWKEELSFGGDQLGYHLTPGLPLVKAGSAKSSLDSSHFFLYYVMSHEFGHLFDFANRLNRCTGKTIDDPNCQVESGSWSALSWLGQSKVRPENEFTGRSGLCFYSCEGKFPDKGIADTLYQGFARSNFISTYASTNMYDDFAESVATYTGDKYQGLRYELDDGLGRSYDVVQKLHSALFRSKLDYVDAFFHRHDIVYP